MLTNLTIKLKDNLAIPVIGFGTWQLKGEECRRTVSDALAIGYRHIDTADRYGNHHEVAAAIKDSGVDRSELFITTKIWLDSLHHQDVLADVDRFLNELELEYIDLLLIHWPNKDVAIAETLGAIEECRKVGKVKAIGVSNFTTHHLEEALATGIEIVNNQVELHPSFNQKELRQYCDQKNISVTAYSPLRAGDMDLPIVRSLSLKYGHSPAQIILNWIVSRNMIVIPQSTDKERMKENLSVTEFVIDEADLALLDSVPQGERFNDPEFGEFDRWEALYHATTRKQSNKLI